MTTPAEALLKRRITLVTGKGGVGKTTVTAALGLYASRKGRRVLLLDVERSLEPPSQLLAYLGHAPHFVKDVPVSLAPGLFCARLSATAGHHTFLEEQLPFRWLAGAAMRSKYLHRFLSMAPGFQELGMIYRMMPYIRQKERDGSWTYDHLLVDLPATGHALAMTSIPGPMLDVFESGPIANGIREAQGYFNDSKQTGALVVSLPEPLVISETVELLGGLSRDQLAISGVVVNQMPPNPWNQDQRQAVLNLFEQIKEPLLGAWTMQRVSRSAEAIAKLREKIGLQYPQSALAFVQEQREASSPKERVTTVMQALSSVAAGEPSQ